jgi:hypothetical protein
MPRFSPLPEPSDRTYILDENNAPIRERSLLKWADWFTENGHRLAVASSDIGEFSVSTVFLGLDHSISPLHPLLFETAVYHDGKLQNIWRCATWPEAQAQHARIVATINDAAKRTQGTEETQKTPQTED